MASKMYKFMLAGAAIIVFQTVSFAQTTTDWGWNWKDSSVVPVKKMPQYNEFLSNSFPYPPKPRNQWELGITVGNAFVIGDRPIFTSKYNGGVVLGASLRKALDHSFSLRSTFYFSNTHIPGYTSGGARFLEVRNTSLMGNIDVIYSLNTASYYRGNPKTNFYVLGGYSLVYAKIQQRLNSTSQLAPLVYSSRNLIGSVDNGWGLFHAYDFGGGVAFKLSNKINLGFEQKFIVPLFGNDYLDGNKLGYYTDIYSFSTIRLNINL